jgi:hypothetical protein
MSEEHETLLIFAHEWIAEPEMLPPPPVFVHVPVELCRGMAQEDSE